LFARPQSELLEVFKIVGSEIFAVKLEKLVLFGREGNVAEL
jgi:hypothetical protein